MLKLPTLFVLMLTVIDCASQNTDTAKCWTASNKLKWSDFKGKIPIDEQETSTKAICPSEILVYPIWTDGIRFYKVRVVFLKMKAWTRDSTKYSLNHEQLHFDIAELYARKIRKRLKEYKGEYNSHFKEMVNALITESLQQEGVYDDETIHGAFVEGQQKWINRICSELDLLKEYASTLQDCIAR